MIDIPKDGSWRVSSGLLQYVLCLKGRGVYKVHFHIKNVDYELVASSLDLSHPYFVSIKDMDFDYEEGVVVNPHLENTRKRFRDTQTLMIPFQNCYLIEQFYGNKTRKQAKMLVLEPESP